MIWRTWARQVSGGKYVGMGTYQRVRVTGAAVTTKAGGETEIGGRDMEVCGGSARLEEARSL